MEAGDGGVLEVELGPATVEFPSADAKLLTSKRNREGGEESGEVDSLPFAALEVRAVGDNDRLPALTRRGSFYGFPGGVDEIEATAFAVAIIPDSPRSALRTARGLGAPSSLGRA